jgi:hypothetical protein
LKKRKTYATKFKIKKEKRAGIGRREQEAPGT